MSDAASAPRRSPADAWRRLRPFVAASRAKIILLSASSVLGGFVEAGILVVLVRIAVAMSSGEREVEVGALGVHVGASVPQLFLFTLLLCALRLAFMWVSAYLPALMSTEAQARLRKETFHDFLNAQWDLQSKQREGDIQDLLTQQVNRAAQAVFLLTDGLTGLFNFLALMISAVAVNPPAALVIVVAVAILFFVLRPMTRRARRYSKLRVDAQVVYANSIAEAITMAEEIQVFGAAEAEERLVGANVDAISRPYLRAQFLGNVMPALYQAIAITLVVGGLGIIYATGGSRLASLGAVVLILMRALSYSQSLQNVYHRLNDLAPSMERVRNRKRLFADRAVRRDGLPLERIDTIRFEAVRFAYVKNRRVLNDITFRIEKGEAVGIVGPSGAGKSTLIQLLLRLRDPTAGRYLVNDRQAAEFALDFWHRRIAYVPQDSRLLSASARENIRFFRDDITDEAVERAARMAQIHDDIVSWKDGYDTIVGQRADAVSGGQRQRLSLARALAHAPDVIILDEPTSALDVRSEALVQQSLESLKGNVTLFVIAHRLSTLNICDRIMVLNRGALEAFEPAATLAASNHFYRDAVELSRLR